MLFMAVIANPIRFSMQPEVTGYRVVARHDKLGVA